MAQVMKREVLQERLEHLQWRFEWKRPARLTEDQVDEAEVLLERVEKRLDHVGQLEDHEGQTADTPEGMLRRAYLIRARKDIERLSVLLMSHADEL